MYKPRPYQQDAHDAVIDWWKKSTEPCLVSATTGAGKSLIIAMIAKTLFDLSGGKRVLCLAPTAELIEQNAEKYKSFGNECSIYSASISRSLRHNVVFASEGTFKSVAKRLGHEFAGVICDEAHKITNTVKKIISDMRESSPKLRVCGLTATPYRLGDGYIYGYDIDNNPIPSDQTKNPYYHRLVYEISADYLINNCFLTRPHADLAHVNNYDMSGVKLSSKKQCEEAVEQQGRLTAEIVDEVVRISSNRMGVMIFAATIKHAQEIMESLPKHDARMIGGTINMRKRERAALVSDFKNMKYKYLVNVSTMTTGVDFTHVDTIAILRATESASLLQQIIGRGMRIHPHKKDCLVLDYAGNIERHQLEDDLFSPMISARTSKKGEQMDVCCPSCNSVNQFTARKNDSGLDIDNEGYFCDLMGNRIMYEEGQPLPAHHGRRCFGYSLIQGRSARCEHRWSVKLCEECEHENDITARHCEKCKAELIDPNAKLARDFHRVKADPYQVSTDKVIGFTLEKWTGKSGNLMLKAHYITEFRKFDYWYNPSSKSAYIYGAYKDFSEAYFNGKVAPDADTFYDNKDKGTPPETITYARKKGTKYFEVYGHNKPEDSNPDMG